MTFLIIIDGVAHQRVKGTLRETACGREPRNSWTIAEVKSRPGLPRCRQCFPPETRVAA